MSTTRINLLDWREELREQRKQQFFAMLGLGAAFSASIIGLMLATLGTQIDNQVSRNSYLQTQIAEADQKIKEIEELEAARANLIARMRVIETLQASRSATVHFFDEIINTLPDGVNLTSIKQSGSKITLDGVAESNGRVSTYMKNLDSSPWFSDPKLVVIKTSERDRQRKSEFTLEVQNMTQAKKADEKAPAVGGAGS